MRGYIKKDDDGRIRTAIAGQGTVFVREHYMGDRAGALERWVTRYADQLKPGLYRLQIVGGRCASVILGRRVASASTEAKRLARSKAGRGATTGTPGICGYQQRADASAEAARCRAIERERFIQWLRSLAQEARSTT